MLNLSDTVNICLKYVMTVPHILKPVYIALYLGIFGINFKMGYMGIYECDLTRVKKLRVII